MKVVVDPRQQMEFARFLTEYVSALSLRNNQLMLASERLQRLWMDERYKAYSLQMAEASQSIHIFEQQAKRFIVYLNAKASAGRKYLNR